MKPLYNLTDPFFDLREWKILSQAALENIPIPPSFVITKETFKQGLTNPEINKQLKSIYSKLASGASSNMNIYAYTNGEYKFHISKKGFDAFIDELSALYNTLKVRRDDDEFSLLVQRNIIAESSGILYTSEIETNNTHLCTVEAIYGQESFFLDSVENADRYAINKDQEIIVDKFIVKQEKMIVTGPDDAITQEIEISPRWQSKQKLDDRHVLMLMEIAKYLEENFQPDLEVRWSYEGGKLYIINIQKRVPLINIEPRVKDIQLFDLEKIIKDAPIIEIIPSSVDQTPDLPKPPILEQSEKIAGEDFIPQFLKSESELDDSQLTTSIKLSDIPESFSQPIVEQKYEASKISSPINIKPDKHAVKSDQIPSILNASDYKEDILIKGLGINGNSISGIATKDTKAIADILVISSIESINKRDVAKFNGFVIDNLVDVIPDFLKDKIVVSSTNIGTKLIQDGEYIKINGKNGIVYELVKDTQNNKLPDKKSALVEEKLKVKPIEIPIAKSDKPEIKVVENIAPIPQIKEEKVYKTATKVYLKSHGQNKDSENYSGYITSSKDLINCVKLNNTKNILVQTTSQIEKDAENIKSIRNQGNKNVWLVLPKVTRFNEIENYRKRIQGLRRSSTFKIFGYVATPANALLVDKYIDYILDGLYVDLKSLKAGLIGEEPTEEYKLPGLALLKCMQEISSKTKKKKFTVFLDIDGFKVTKSLIHEIASLGFNNICANSNQIEKLKQLLVDEEKSKILKSIKGTRR